MTQVQKQWDVSLTMATKRGSTLQATIPAAIGRVLIERRQLRATLTVTADGIMLKPYDGTGLERVDLPEWGEDS